MKPIRPIAALFAACTLSLANAQSPDPIASVSRSDPGADAIAQEISADATMQGSKIAVQPDDGGSIILTGVTPTWKQMRRAVDIATKQAGEGKVVNAIQTEEVVIDLTGNVPSETSTAITP